MAQRSLHSALKTEVTSRLSVEGVEYIIAKLQSSKDSIEYSLHVTPTTIMADSHPGDLLNNVGFQRCNCAFSPHSFCFAIPVPDDFPLEVFADAFGKAFQALQEAMKRLRECGFHIDQPNNNRARGNGHVSPKSELKKQSEDENFFYNMSWIDGGSDKGWTMHYRPKHPPLTAELQATFDFLNLRQFEECPYFDFEPCYWRFFPYEQRGDSIYDGNADYVFRVFNNQSDSLSLGLKNLVKVHGLLQPFGFYFFPQLREPKAESQTKEPPVLPRAKDKSGKEVSKFDYEVAVSFAGTERILAEELANLVKDAGYEVFYDDFYPEHLWGKDLVVFFDNIYRKKSRYCVIFVSHEYNNRMWTTHERRSAQARALEERGREYILPIKVDDSELPGFPPTVGYLSLEPQGIKKIAEILVRKLKL